ncbi:MAG: DUF4249 domain-containing protein [Tannerellaceae bacterium]|jgi:hypothetical protein|nr:DUF4249 domain-containing protein [Tannerellaceae bacterium]
MEFHVLNRKTVTVAFVCFLFAGFFSCEERIKIDTAASAPRLVIYGYITTDTLRHAIRITRSSDYFSTGKPEGISGAIVGIRHKDETYPLTESASEPGLYQTDDNVAGQVGETYTLHISLDFDGDGQLEEYEAESVLPPVSRLDSMAVQPSLLSDHLLEISIWGRLPDQEENYISVHLYCNDRLVNDSLQGFSLADDLFLKKKEIEGLSVLYLNQERESSKLTPGDLLTCQIEGITREYADFISNAQSEHRGSLPLFSSPPANIETNVHSLSGGGVSGFFTAFSISRISMIYR